MPRPVSEKYKTLIDKDISEFERHRDFKQIAARDASLMGKDKEELREEVAKLRQVNDAHQREIRFLKVKALKQEKGQGQKRVLDTEDQAVKDLREAE